MGFSTDSIHGAQPPDKQTGAVVSPLYLSTTFARRSVDSPQSYTYSRENNPTRETLEKLIAILEGGTEGIAFASGMAAITAVFSLFSNHDNIIVTENVFGGTSKALRRWQEQTGVEFSLVDTSNLLALKHAVSERTKLIFVETPTNPLLKVSDIREIGRLTKKQGITLCVDNSCLTPYLQKPLELGADLVVHSTSKYLGGHNDVIGGGVVTGNPELARELRRIQRVHGAVLSPFDCWLLMRGIKTLALRMERHSQNGHLIASYLSNHKKVARVFYPGLASHPGHELAQRQCRGFGGLVSFELRDPDLVLGFLDNLKVFTLAENIGGVESLACHPYSMTYGHLTRDEKESLGIAPSLVRLSAGIEDVEDLIEDIDNAFSKAG